jgi:hypothetical protein
MTPPRPGDSQPDGGFGDPASHACDDSAGCGRVIAPFRTRVRGRHDAGAAR